VIIIIMEEPTKCNRKLKVYNLRQKKMPSNIGCIIAPLLLCLSEWFTIVHILRPIFSSMTKSVDGAVTQSLVLLSIETCIAFHWAVTLILSCCVRYDAVLGFVSRVEGQAQTTQPIDTAANSVIGFAMMSPFLLSLVAFWNFFMWGAVAPVFDWNNAADYPYIWNRFLVVIMVGPFLAIGVFLLFFWGRIRLLVALTIAIMLQQKLSSEKEDLIDTRQLKHDVECCME
jgi:hypothetical protein